MTVNIGRRELIAALGSAAAWPLAARGQQSKVARIGALYIGTADAQHGRTRSERTMAVPANRHLTKIFATPGRA